jgi:hypothetical protein
VLKTINQITQYYIQKECGPNCISELYSRYYTKTKATSVQAPYHQGTESEVQLKEWVLDGSCELHGLAATTQ